MMILVPISDVSSVFARTSLLPLGGTWATTATRLSSIEISGLKLAERLRHAPHTSLGLDVQTR